MNSSFITSRPDIVRYQPHAVTKPFNGLDFVWKNTINVNQPVPPQRDDTTEYCITRQGSNTKHPQTIGETINNESTTKEKV